MNNFIRVRQTFTVPLGYAAWLVQERYEHFQYLPSFFAIILYFGLFSAPPVTFPFFICVFRNILLYLHADMILFLLT